MTSILGKLEPDKKHIKVKSILPYDQMVGMTRMQKRYYLLLELDDKLELLRKVSEKMEKCLK